MKNYISTLILICFASFSQAQNPYESQWKNVSNFEKEGLTKSAAAIVEKIYNLAKKNDDPQQRIKALIYKSKYMLTLEEDAQLNIVNNFKSEIETSDIITKHLLENLLATMYWQYFQQNRYQFYERTTTSTKVSDDFRTWDLETLFKEIHSYYERSLENGLLLQQESLDKYKILITEAKGSKDFRPTLFDLLSHNALEFYKTDENSITQPSYKFLIDDAKFLSEGDEFINLQLTSKDSSSLQLNALKIYQNLLKFHRNNKASKAYITVDIERLNFVFQHTTIPNKEDALLNTLKANAEALKSSPESALYSFEMASHYHNIGSEYNYYLETETNTIKRWRLKDALELCETVISKFPNSIGAKTCEVLKAQILQPHLQLQTEQFIPIYSPSRILVTYKNLEALDFDIYKVTPKQIELYNSNYEPEERAKFFKSLKPFKSFSSALKSEGDYQSHSTELVLPKLPNGLYLIKADTKTDFNVFGSAKIQVTNLALIESTGDTTYHYQLINRNNGEPITNAKVEMSYSQNGTKSKGRKTFTTDRFGKFKLNRDQNRYRDVELKTTYQNDTAYFGEYYINRAYKETTDRDSEKRSFLFTDRSIYRPGQTVYFKGIATTTKNEKTEVNSNAYAEVKLINVNNEVVSEQTLKTNDFGSVNGEFILPNNGLTGNYMIELFCGNSSYTTISVEEYKRPKFKPEFEAVTDTYKVNDSITVEGKAVAFAGSNISDAKVVYRVKRQVQYPSWYYWTRPYYNFEPQEITFGETKTNAKGSFEIEFKAIPDESVSKESLPVFRYEVTAEITDINGETRTATTTVSVGYHAMTLNINASNAIDTSKKETEITLNSQNLNGEFSPAKGTVKIYKLQAPETVLRPRPWRAPDFQVLSKAEFKALFPHEPYNNEDDISNWQKGKEVFSTTFDTEKERTITLKKIHKWASGRYIIIAESQDKFGQLVKDEVYTTLFNSEDKTIADLQLFEAQLDKSEYKVGSTAKLTLASAAKDLTVTVEIEKEGDVISTQLVRLNNSKQTISIPVLESDLGRFAVHFSYAAYNSFSAQTYYVLVPYPDSDLEIETTTFRDKLQPGQDETWSFKIKGPKGDKVSAELLASMYDASLDEFRSHNWSFNPIVRPSYYTNLYKNSSQSFGNTNFRLFNNFYISANYPSQNYDRLNWFGLYFGYSNANYMLRGKARGVEALMVEDSYELETPMLSKSEMASNSQGFSSGLELNQESNSITSDSVYNKSKGEFAKFESLDTDNIQIRTNLNETAFFFPELRTDAEGNVSFNFKAPEALTQWNLQLLAHTKNLESKVTQLRTVTQKELMVIPNAPRFLREGDEITISAKIANLTDKALSGNAQLVLTDAISGEDITTTLLGSSPLGKLDGAFTVDAKGNTQVSWSLNIPEGLQAVQYKVIAKAGDFSDGEQNALPVLSNRMLVTETLPMWVRSNQTKTFTLDKLKTNTSTTIKNHKLTLEITSNPAWYAVQALPYLMEYPYDCNEQTFARYYSNALAQHIVTSNPKIEAVFNQWKSQEALLSNLEKNQELKSLLIQETPWLRDAQSEAEQKKRIGLLFDLNKMTNELQANLRQLKTNQYASGAWPWFKGGGENRYITQHIVAGFGHLKHLNVIPTERNDEAYEMIKNAIQYLDAEFIEDYKDLKKFNNNADLSKDHLSFIQLHYLYVRSFYPEIETSKEVKTIMAYYETQIQKYWLNRSLYAKGLMALTMHRKDDAKTAKKILKSLKENSITSDGLGMYWKENTNSWFWYQAPIETQALLIEAFSEIENDMTTVDNLKIWLLKNKQTNQWKTTKATTEAVYALLLNGSDWLDVSETVDVKVGNEVLSPSTLDEVKLEAGTGYYKTSWTGSEITAEQADITLTKKGDGIAWGALYWQYFEDLDNITSAETPLKLRKKLFLKTNTDKGEVISEITPETTLGVGDLVRVRIELRTDRNMEFVHLKDMRAAGFEPINVLSQYKWQDGLGYYESTKDAATNFFIDYLPKGIYVFEYDLRVNNAGDMSNGISTIQSMYAPEFSSHSNGIRISVE